MAKHLNKEFNIQIVQTILKRNWYWPIIFPILFFSLGYLYLRYTKAVFESSAVIQIQDKDQGKEVLDIENIGNKNNLSSNIELLKSPVLFENAIQHLDLGACFFNKGSILTSQLYGSNNTVRYRDLVIIDSSIIGTPIYFIQEDEQLKLSYQLPGLSVKAPITINQRITTPHFQITLWGNPTFFKEIKNRETHFIIQNPATLASQMMPNLRIMPVNVDAQTIEIKFESNNAYLARDVVNAVIAEFFVFDEKMKKKSSENILNFLNNQLDSLSKELSKSRDSIVFFQQRNKLNDPNSVADQLIDRINLTQEELLTTTNNLASLRDIKNRINSSNTEQQLANIILEISNEEYSGTIGKQIEQLQELILSRDLLLNKVQSENPEITIKKRQIDQKVNEIKQSIGFLEKKYQRLNEQVIDKRNKLENDYLSVPEKKIEYSRLKSTEELFNKYYSMLMERRTQYAISNAGYQPSSRVLSKALVNSSPIKPKVGVIYTLCIVFGGILGVLILLIKYVTYNEIDSSKDLAQMLNNRINVIGELPALSMRSEHSQIRIEKHKNTRLAEILRTMRSNIQFINPDFKTISITSSVSGEGKTFVALNLAAIIAYSGKKTVIIDLDLRKPKVHLAFNNTNTIGVSSILIKQNTIEECIKPTQVENLDLITSGPQPPNPSELILKKEFDEMIQELSKTYDAIIIDTPPVGIVSDGISVMSKADIPIYVFRSNYSKRDYIERVEEIMSLLKINSLNIVLNGIDLKKTGFLKNVKQDYIKNYYIDED